MKPSVMPPSSQVCAMLWPPPNLPIVIPHVPDLPILSSPGRTWAPHSPNRGVNELARLTVAHLAFRRHTLCGLRPRVPPPPLAGRCTCMQHILPASALSACWHVCLTGRAAPSQLCVHGDAGDGDDADSCVLLDHIPHDDTSNPIFGKVRDSVCQSKVVPSLPDEQQTHSRTCDLCWRSKLATAEEVTCWANARCGIPPSDSADT